MRRRGLRGAAMVEALSLLTLFVLLCILIMYAFELYGHVLNAKSEARSSAWAHALNSCKGNAGTATTATDADGATLDDVLDDDHASGTAEDMPMEGEQLLGDSAGHVTINDSWGVARASAKRTVLRTLPGAPSHDIHASFEVQCDEEPKGASPADLLSFLWNLPSTLNLSK
ncbi:MAG: hypothetical protein R3B13_05665 [Polyangiaceae bacterium]